jgi:MFS family permease
MNPKLRIILAVLAGLVVGSILIALVQLFSPYQPPADLDMNDKTKLAEWVKTLPLSAFFIVLLSYFLGSVAGGWLTNLIAAPAKYRPALVTGFGLFVAGVMNLLAIPHPTWFAIVSSLIYFIGAWAGGRLVGKADKSSKRY